MPEHRETRVLPYTPAQMFDLVAGVERYPEFLPWCIGARILRRHEDVFFADLVIGWKVIRERFTSKVTLAAPGAIHVDYIQGPLKYLHNDWRFAEAPGGSEVD